VHGKIADMMAQYTLAHHPSSHLPDLQVRHRPLAYAQQPVL